MRPSPTHARPALTALLAAWAFCTSQAPSAAPPAPDPCAIHTTERVVAVGDVHGAYEPFVAILREAGLIDTRNRWIGGRAWLVQTGDVLDRGPDSRRALDLLRALERSAPKAGGGVLVLLGNHELMRLTGDWRYVSRAEVTAFGADAAGVTAFREAFAPNGRYGRWLRSHAAVAKINDVVFVHGGISPAVAMLGCAGINAKVSAELAALADTGDASSPLASDEAGPLWYRGLATEPEDAFAQNVTKVLSALGAHEIVIGHTVSAGRIVQRFGSRVIMIDTGMIGGEFARDGAPSALELRGAELTALYLGGRRENLLLPR